MIDKGIFSFLSALNLNNHREWFNSNKADYNKAKTEFEMSVAKIIPEVAAIDKGVKSLAPKDCIFRIFRDVRFSKDKRPYKTNFGAYMVKGGKKSGLAGYYIHVEPGNSFVGGGIYCPPSDNLKAVRDEIVNFTDEFKAIIENKTFKKHFKEIQGDRLKTPPRGFDKDFAEIELLKFKDFTVFQKVSDDFLTSDKALKETMEIFRAMLPFNEFINQAIENK